MGISKIIDEKQYRIKRNGEIFTPPELANKLLSALPREVWQKDKTFLDPACGDGNLLIAVLQRKIELGHKPLEALQSVYGVDIMADNIQECRLRLLKILSLFAQINKDHVRAVVQNIAWIDPQKYPNGSLDYDFEFRENQVSESDINQWMNWETSKDLPVSTVWPIRESIF